MCVEGDLEELGTPSTPESLADLASNVAAKAKAEQAEIKAEAAAADTLPAAEAFPDIEITETGIETIAETLPAAEAVAALGKPSTPLEAEAEAAAAS